MNWLVSLCVSVILIFVVMLKAFRIYQRLIFLLSICILISIVQVALISQLLSDSSPSIIQRKLFCPHKFQCPNNITHFSIHIDKHPEYENISYIRSPVFSSILETIRNSSYYTNDSSSACVHIAPVDTIDRDRRSKNGYYIYFIEQRLKFFREWSDPNKIHLIFNHYTGTWPSYRRTLDFHLPSHYILASTGFTSNTYDCSLHLTFPLFHSDYPSNISFPSSSRSVLLSFKGKSYEDVQHHRTFFRHLHNNQDIIITYTDNQNNSSDQFEYIQLIRESHFCLVPSGRRLYSYRFLEVLQHGCIPVITTNDNEFLILPFSEIIDWSKSVIMYSNLSLSLLPYYLRMIKENQRVAMQRECLNIWLKYFSSIERIVLTSLDIINDRFMSSFLFSIQP